MTPKISVIIPVYNTEKHINNCLEYILKQTYTDFEVVLIDDGSTDRSLEICNKIGLLDSRLRVISQENGGVSYARNTGIMNAQGEFITFIDSDDLVAPNYLSFLLEGITATNAILSMCSHTRIHDYSYEFPSNQGMFLEISAMECAKRLLNGQFPVSACGVLFKKKLIGDIRFSEGINSNEDKLFLYEYLLKNENDKVYYSNEKLYGYMVREGSSTRSSWKGSLDIVKVADKIKRLTMANHMEWEELVKNTCMVARVKIMKAIVLSENKNDYLHVFKKMRNDVLTMGFPKSSGRRLQIEYLTIKLGRPFFTLLVYLYYGITSEKQRFHNNERVTYQRKEQ